MPTPYTSSTLGTIGTKFGTIPDFFNDFACACDGVTDDTTAANNALAAVAGSGKPAYIYVPSGMNLAVNYLTIPAGAQVTLLGQGKSSIVTFLGTPAGTGRVIIPPGSSGVRISGLAFEGRAVSPTLIDYASSPTPTQTNLKTGSTFWIQGGTAGGVQTNDIEISDCWVNHTEGYLAYIDATGGSISVNNSLSNIHIERLRSKNSRNNWFGASGSFIYGGFGGGILVASDGVYSNVEHLMIRLCRFDRHSGNVIWMWAPATTLLNRNISLIENYIRVCALSGIQFAVCDGGLEQGNVIEGYGYASTSDSDVFGTPRWLNSGGYNITPVGYDTSGRALRLVRRGNRAWGNGNGYDLDCMGDGIVDGNHLVSSWASTDPNAQSSSCGPGGSGSNTAVGINCGNTNNVEGGSFLTITNNRIAGFGADGIAGNTARNTLISNNTIDHPGTSTGHPIALRNIVPVIGYVHDDDNAFNTTVTGNKINWPTSGGGWAIVEDASNHTFASGDVNLVFGNQLTGNCSEFEKAASSSSMGGVNSIANQGAVTISSVTPLAAPFTAAILQVEGLTSAGWATKVYKHLTGAQQIAFIDNDAGTPVALIGTGGPGGVSYAVSGSWSSSVATFSYATTAWGGGTTYGAGALVSSAGIVYVSLAGSNTGNTPNVSPAWWSIVSIPVGSSIAISGMVPSGYNFSIATVTASTATSVSVAMASNPGSYTSGGTVSNLSAGGTAATGNRSSASIGDLVATGFAFLEGGAFFPTTASYSVTAKQNALAGSSSLNAAGIRYDPVSGDFQKTISVSGGLPVWVPLGGGTTNYTALSQYDWSFTVGSGVTGSLGTAGANSVTFTSLPFGVVTGGLVYISGGTGIQEICRITVSGSVVSFTTLNAHTGSWVISSGTRGLLEQFAIPTTNNYPFIIQGRGGAPAYQQTDAAMLIGRNTSDDSLLADDLNRCTLSVHTDYSAPSGNCAGVLSFVKVSGNHYNFGHTAVYAHSESDAASGGIVGSLIALHGEAKAKGAGTSIAVNAEGSTVGGVHYGVVSNIGTGADGLNQLYAIVAASWSSSGGGQATFTVASHTILDPTVNAPYPTYVNVLGVAPSGYNVRNAPVISVTSTTIVVSMPSNPGSFVSCISGQGIVQSPVYIGASIAPHHQFWNDNGAGMWISSDAGVHAYGLKIEDTSPPLTYLSGTSYSLNDTALYNGIIYQSLAGTNAGHQPDLNIGTWWSIVGFPGTFAVPFAVKSHSLTSVESAQFIVTDSGTGNIPNILSFYRGPTKICSVTADVQTGTYTDTRLRLSVMSNGTYTDMLTVYVNGISVVGVAATASISLANGYVDSAEGFYTASTSADAVHVPNGTVHTKVLTVEYDINSAVGPIINMVNSAGSGSGEINFYTYDLVHPTAQWLASDTGNFSSDHIFSTSVGGSGGALATRFSVYGANHTVPGQVVVAGLAANPSLAVSNGFVQSAQGFYCPTAEDGLHVYDGTNNGYVFMHAADHNMYVTSDQDVYLHPSSGRFVVVSNSGVLDVGTITHSSTISISTGVDLGSNGLNCGGLTIPSVGSPHLSILGTGDLSTVGIVAANSYWVGSTPVISSAGEFTGNGIFMTGHGFDIGSISPGTNKINGNACPTGSFPIAGGLSVYYDNGLIWKVA